MDQPSLIPLDKPVEFLTNDEIPDGEIVRHKRKSGEPFRFSMSANTMVNCWREMKEMKEQIEFLVSATSETLPARLLRLHREQNQP